MKFSQQQSKIYVLFTPYLKNLADNKFTATIGNSSKINENSSLYDDIIDL